MLSRWVGWLHYLILPVLFPDRHGMGPPGLHPDAHPGAVKGIPAELLCDAHSARLALGLQRWAPGPHPPVQARCLSLFWLVLWGKWVFLSESLRSSQGAPYPDFMFTLPFFYEKTQTAWNPRCLVQCVENKCFSMAGGGTSPTAGCQHWLWTSVAVKMRGVAVPLMGGDLSKCHTFQCSMPSLILTIWGPLWLYKAQLVERPVPSLSYISTFSGFPTSGGEKPWDLLESEGLDWHFYLFT